MAVTLLPSICLEPFSAGEFDHYEVWNMAPFPFSLILCTVTFQLYNAIKPWKSPKEQQKMNGSYCTLDFIPREQGLCPICNLNHVVMLFTLNDVSWLGCRKKSDMFFPYKLTQCLPTTNSTFKKKKKINYTDHLHLSLSSAYDPKRLVNGPKTRLQAMPPTHRFHVVLKVLKSSIKKISSYVWTSCWKIVEYYW